MLVSSAKRKKFNFLETVGRSLMKIRNNNGPRTEPCGTPHVISKISEETPFTNVSYTEILKRSK